MVDKANADQAAAPGWSAAVGAMDAERRGILRNLLPLHPRVVRDPEKARILAELQTIRAGVDKLQASLGTPDETPAPPRPPPSRTFGEAAPSVRTVQPPRWWEFWRW